MLGNTFSMREKFVLFWHDHFATEWDKVRVPQFNFIINDLCRKYVFGNFKEFVKKITLDPCMLYYLDGVYSTKSRPNENYGRELMELFTLGIYDAQGSATYTEADIQNAARSLAGWVVNQLNPAPKAVYELFTTQIANRVDNTNKTFFGQTGNFHVDEIIDMIFAKQPAMSEFICRKLYHEFVYEIADETIVQQLAAIFRSSNFEIKPVLVALFKSAHFFDNANIGSHIQNPLEFTAGISRSLGLNFTATGDLDMLYNQSVGLGMQLFDPPNVKGWPAYRSWISSSLLPSRWGFGDNIVDGRNYTLKFDGYAFANTFPNPKDAELLVRYIAEPMLTTKLSENQITVLINTLMGGASTDGWPDIMDTTPAIAARQVRAFMKAILRIGENQLC